MKEAFIAYVGDEFKGSEFEQLLDEANCDYDYTTKVVVAGPNDEAVFGKIVFDSYSHNRRDPELGDGILGVGGYDLTLLHEVVDKLAGGRYNPRDRDADQRLARQLYKDFGVEAFHLMGKMMPFSCAFYDPETREFVAARGRDLNAQESYANLFYGLTAGGNTIFSNCEALIAPLCATVLPVSANTYYKDGTFTTYEQREFAHSDDAGLRTNYTNARSIIDLVNGILEQAAAETLQDTIDAAFNEYFSGVNAAEKVADYVKSNLQGQIADEVGTVIQERIDGMATRERIDTMIDEDYRRRFDLFMNKTATPEIKVIELNSVEKARTDLAFYHQRYEQVLAQVHLGEPVMLVGPAGSGKNFAIDQVCQALGLEMHYTNNASNEFKLTGFMDAGGNYQETEFYKAFKYGGVFFLDEIDNSDPSALIVINSALANGYMAFPHETVQKHPDFHCVAAANTWGAGSNLQYVGRNALDAATLDRFDMVFFDYDKRLEQALYPDEELLEFMWELRRTVDKCHIPHIVSTRAIGKCYKKRQYGLDLETILRTNVIRSLSQDDLSIIIGNMKEVSEDNPWFSTIKTMRVIH